MSYYKYFISIASVFVWVEASVLPTWELVCLFLLNIGWLVSVGVGIIFKRVIARFAMFLYNAVLTRLRQFFCLYAVLIHLRQFFGLYENQSAYFYCKLVAWFYLVTRLSLYVLMKDVYDIFKISFLMSF